MQKYVEIFKKLVATSQSKGWMHEWALWRTLEANGECFDGGPPIPLDPQSYADKKRQRDNFRCYRRLLSFLQLLQLYSTRVIEVPSLPGHGPVDAIQEYPTKLGIRLAKLPDWLIRLILSVADFAITTARIVKRYKWVFGLVSTLFTGISWLYVHGLPHVFLLIAIGFGMIVGTIGAWIAHLLHRSNVIDDIDPPDSNIT